MLNHKKIVILYDYAKRSLPLCDDLCGIICKEIIYLNNNVYKLYKLCIIHGLIDIIKILHKKYPIYTDKDIYTFAIKNGQLDVIKYLDSMGGFDYSENKNNLLFDALESGYFDIIKYIYYKGNPIYAPCYYLTIRYYYNIDVFKFLYENGWNRCGFYMGDIYGEAIYFNKPEIVKYLFENGHEIEYGSEYDIVFKYLYNNNIYQLKKTNINEILDNPYYERVGVIKYLYKIKFKYYYIYEFMYSIKHGYIDFVKRSYKNIMNYNDSQDIINNGLNWAIKCFIFNLDVVKYLHEIGADLSTIDVDNYIRYVSQIDNNYYESQNLITNYLRENGVKL
jgi:hypothetical protein